MKHISELSSILSTSLPRNKPHATLLAQLMVAFCAVRTVNLKQVVNAIHSSATADSRYRQLQRFFASTDICFDGIARFIVRLFFNESAQLSLTMDRTNWQYGRANINILMLGICYKKRAIPLCWMLLNKKGNSNTEERIHLISRFIELFGTDRIDVLLADREFVGGDWFRWLRKQGVPFNIRIKQDAITTNSRGLDVDIDGLFYHLKPGEELTLPGARQLWQESVYLAGLRLHDGELLIIATSNFWPDSIKIYAKRWEIETLFECLKGRGFNFEATRLTAPERVSKMVAVLALTYCWAHKTGEWRCEQGDGIKVKKHGRLEKSLFRHGLDLLQQIALGSCISATVLRRCCYLMKPRPMVSKNIGLFTS